MALPMTTSMRAHAPESTLTNVDHSAQLALRPNVTEREAFRMLHGSGLGALYLRTLRGPLQRLATAYVPFRLYRVEYDLGRTHNSRTFGLDQVDGSLDLFEFKSVPVADQMVALASRNVLPARISTEQADAALREKSLRTIFQKGFFQVRNLALRIEPLTEEFCMPYWLGFYGTDGTLRCRVMDAIRRRMEGSKAATLFETWLISD
jgi:hypothetical protein